MKTKSMRWLCVAATMAGALISVEGPSYSEDYGTLPSIKESKGDTLKMSCGEARGLVHGEGGTLLNSGPNHYDLYHRSGESCQRDMQELQPAFVRTRDNPLCFVGYTCENKENSK